MQRYNLFLKYKKKFNKIYFYAFMKSRIKGTPKAPPPEGGRARGYVPTYANPSGAAQSL